MFALIAAILAFLGAFGVAFGSINLWFLVAAFFSLHFAWGIGLPLPSYGPRRHD